jgi:hypothetical protein
LLVGVDSGILSGLSRMGRNLKLGRAKIAHRTTTKLTKDLRQPIRRVDG